jgi:FAD/FMN-containing dehydrogenase
MLFVFLAAYLLTGFFNSVLSFGVVSGSSAVSIAIITGMIALNAGGSKTALAATAKNQLI